MQGVQHTEMSRPLGTVAFESVRNAGLVSALILTVGGVMYVPMKMMRDMEALRVVVKKVVKDQEGLKEELLAVKMEMHNRHDRTIRK